MKIDRLAGWHRTSVDGPGRKIRRRSAVRHPLRSLVVLAGVPVLALGLTAGIAVASGAGRATSYTGPGIDYPWGIAAGPDGALWFTNDGNNSIGRISTAGKIITYTDPDIGRPEGITAGPDGALWFANYYGDSIGRITTAGKITTYPVSGLSVPNAISAGPDGALWFTDYGNNTIGRITTTATPPSTHAGRSTPLTAAPSTGW